MSNTENTNGAQTMEIKKVDTGCYEVLNDGEYVGDLEREYIPQANRWDSDYRARQADGTTDGHYAYVLSGRDLQSHSFRTLKLAKAHLAKL